MRIQGQPGALICRHKRVVGQGVKQIHSLLKTLLHFSLHLVQNLISKGMRRNCIFFCHTFYLLQGFTETLIHNRDIACTLLQL